MSQNKTDLIITDRDNEIDFIIFNNFPISHPEYKYMKTTLKKELFNFMMKDVQASQ